MKQASPEQRLLYRQKEIKPLVDEFFDWVKEKVDRAATEGTRKALQYAINQELYLRAFLDDGMIPLDNSDAERSIRSFCVGKHSWHVTAASRGAEISGILYSLAETAKANHLKPYEYFKWLLEQMLLHEGNLADEILNSMLPWSEEIPNEIRETK